ncbi:hypothetical protein FB45DRAFT_731454 [Roridomyces roridus]|uniref:Uncharacterized protein n=1 Tax=Roridomyces roridus TaxID=1738132 RepID=A0AAD7FYX4_9AGAR|nr:hypothetical protein FB45DRAFT_731454 [Roridomyces roridus]
MSEQNFRIDVRGTRASAWNKSAARVFAPIVMRNEGYRDTHETRHLILSAFTAHMDTLIRRFRHLNKSKEEQESLESQARRRSRKYQVYLVAQLFLRRHRTGIRLPLLHDQIPMLEELGIDTMSCDESERGTVDVETRYRISSPDWRADKVTQWLRTFDSAYHISRKLAPPKAGAPPRVRYAPTAKSKGGRAVPDLPVSAYNSNWLQEHQQQRYDVAPRADETYDFTPGTAVMELVSSRHFQDTFSHVSFAATSSQRLRTSN